MNTQMAENVSAVQETWSDDERRRRRDLAGGNAIASSSDACAYRAMLPVREAGTASDFNGKRLLVLHPV